jgi:membrane-bound lytic murein transglycosylase D
VEAAEKAFAAGNLDEASNHVEEAEVLLSGWSAETLLKADVARLKDRIETIMSQIEEAETPVPESEAGLKLDTEVVKLSGEDLRAETTRVKSAEHGQEFDVPIDLNNKVMAWIHTFTTERRNYIQDTLCRATRYLPMVKQVFAEEGIPEDIAYLAIIESGFKNTARSRARAVGMWQFIRSTARLYGLNGNAWVEERRDPMKATRAAARYLKALYEREGDWYLALLGYNAGPLTTDRASQALGTRNFWDMARSRYLRNETKNYVPEFCAAILIGKNPERYGFHVEQMKPYAFETVDVEKQTSLSVLARHANTSVEELKELNPELLRATTPPKRYVLRVPPGTSQTVARAMAKIPSGQRLDFRTYRVRKGDTITRVAARFKVSPEDLLLTNGLSAEQFRAGKTLRVPPPSSLPIDSLDLLSKQEREKILSEQPLPSLPPVPSEKVDAKTVPTVLQGIGKDESAVSNVQESLAPKPVEAGGSSAQGLASKPKFHVVKSGETLFSISLRYGIEIKDLKKWNKIRGNRVVEGQRLRLQSSR